jgi:hypothetical protein
MTEKDLGIKRYNLALPAQEFDELQAIADAENSTMKDTILILVKAGLEIHTAAENGAAIIKKESGKETELLLIY